MQEPDGRHRPYIRLGKSARDRRLAAYIADDISQAVNVSALTAVVLVILVGLLLERSITRGLVAGALEG